MSSENVRSYAGRKRVGKVSVIEFKVNNTYEIPVSLVTSDISEFQIALSFAGQLIDVQRSLSDDLIKSKMYEDCIKEVELSHKEQLSKMEQSTTDNFTAKLSDIMQIISDKQQGFNSQIETMRSDYELQIKNIIKEKKKLEEDAVTSAADLEVSLQKEIRNLKKQLAEKNSEVQSLSKGETLIREQCNIESQKLLNIIEEKNSQALEALRKSCDQAIRLKEEALHHREEKVSQREEELQTTLQRNASSSYRGQDGETFFQTLAEEKMKWKLTDTSKIPHSCDYSATIHNIEVFFEMKNYTSDVRSDEVTKFLRDMKEHPEVHIGIFISLHTKITGKDKDKPISIEWINDSQCAVYIQAFKELDEGHTMSLIDQVIKMSSIYSKMTGSKGYMSEESILQGRIDKARVYIEEYITETCSLIKRVVNDQKLHRQLVESSYSHTLAVLKTQSSAINTALEILTGEYKEDNTIDESLIPDTSEIKAKVPKRSKK